MRPLCAKNQMTAKFSTSEGTVLVTKGEKHNHLEKNFINYYGSAGHGRGLVDAMPSFGVKRPLRKEIMNFDFYISSAAELVDLFG